MVEPRPQGMPLKSNSRPKKANNSARLLSSQAMTVKKFFEILESKGVAQGQRDQLFAKYGNKKGKLRQDIARSILLEGYKNINEIPEASQSKEECSIIKISKSLILVASSRKSKTMEEVTLDKLEKMPVKQRSSSFSESLYPDAQKNRIHNHMNDLVRSKKKMAEIAKARTHIALTVTMIRLKNNHNQIIEENTENTDAPNADQQLPVVEMTTETRLVAKLRSSESQRICVSYQD